MGTKTNKTQLLKYKKKISESLDEIEDVNQVIKHLQNLDSAKAERIINNLEYELMDMESELKEYYQAKEHYQKWLDEKGEEIIPTVRV